MSLLPTQAPTLTPNKLLGVKVLTVAEVSMVMVAGWPASLPLNCAVHGAVQGHAGQPAGPITIDTSATSTAQELVRGQRRRLGGQERHASPRPRCKRRGSSPSVPVGRLAGTAPATMTPTTTGVPSPTTYTPGFAGAGGSPRLDLGQLPGLCLVPRQRRKTKWLSNVNTASPAARGLTWISARPCRWTRCKSSGTPPMRRRSRSRRGAARRPGPPPYQATGGQHLAGHLGRHW